MVPADTPISPGRGQYRPLPLDRGLHLLASRFRLAFTARHAEQLLQHLDQFIRLTEAAAPVRKRPYQLAQPARVFRRTGETEWERAVWREYGVIGRTHGPSAARDMRVGPDVSDDAQEHEQGRRVGRGGLAGAPSDHPDARRRGTQRRSRERHAVARDRGGCRVRGSSPEGVATPAADRLVAGALAAARSRHGRANQRHPTTLDESP